MFRFHLPTIPFTVPNLITIAISLTALFLTTRNYLRKAGVRVRGVFRTSSSRDCDDKFVSEVVLENLKDRAITIFAIYLRIGYHCYIELEDLEDKPLVLKAYETYQKHFGPMEFYSVNLRKVDLNDLFSNYKVKKRLILSTSDGKYLVPSIMRRWSPNYEYFKNYMTIIAHPVRSTVKGQNIGGNVKYVVELIPEKGEEEIALIHPSDYETRRFREFALTQDSLTSKAALEQFLQKMQETGKLQSTKIIVHDLQEWRQKKNHSYDDREPVKIEYASAFEYYIAARLYSKYSNWKTDRDNRRRFKNQQAMK